VIHFTSEDLRSCTECGGDGGCYAHTPGQRAIEVGDWVTYSHRVAGLLTLRVVTLLPGGLFEATVVAPTPVDEHRDVYAPRNVIQVFAMGGA